MRNDLPFARRYCEQRGIGLNEYSASLLRQALYPHARAVIRYVRLLSPGFFRVDHDLIHDLAGLRSGADYDRALAEFRGHPANRKNALRSLLLLRVGTRRLSKVVRRVMADRTGKGR